MKFLLDTNTCIVYISGRSPILRQRLLSVHPSDIAVCTPVKAELFYGSARSRDPQRARTEQEFFLNLFISLPFDDASADAYGRIRADLAARGTPIGPIDLLIAAIAVASNLTLVTHNTKEFSRVAGLQIEDWEIAP